MNRPLTLGLTGSIGMGKSTVAGMFREEGVPVFDADAAVHALQGPEGRLVAAIEAAFPGTTGEGGVNRTTLAERVLAAPEALRRLEAIVHPAVGEERARWVAEHADAPLLVFDIPLLFETGGERHVDKVAVVSAPPEQQRDRVLARPGMSEAKFAAILGKQTPDPEKRARAAFVIPTGGSFDNTRAAVRAVIAACLEAAASR